MKSLLPQKAHYYIYIFSLLLLVTGMPLSKFLMSLSQIILICNWILSGHLKSKFSAFFNNKAALVVSSLLLLHFIGLLYTSDLHYGISDIRIKIPLLLLPLILSTSYPLPEKITGLILHLFVGAIIIASIISTLILADVIHRHIVDIRNISIFISHIRFALLICVALFISVYLWMKAQPKRRLVYLAVIAWLLLFLVLMESITGIAALCTVAVVLFIYRISTLESKPVKYSFLLIILGSVAYAGFGIYQLTRDDEQKDAIDFSKLDKLSAQGNVYYHDTTARAYENGHFIWIYYSEKELKEEWAKRSHIDFNWKDKKGNVLRFTLLRFMTSKNLRKDAEGFRQLSDEEVRLVERGVVNVNYQDVSSLKGRLHELAWEIKMYRETGDVDGHSLTQRFEYWKTATEIIAQHPLIGVGTGDIKNAFDEQYEKNKSKLSVQNRVRSHNQYLSMTVAFGIIGLLWFLITLVYPMISCNKTFDFLYITFFIVATISFLTEDTLETQAGVNFYAFFNAFFLFVYRPQTTAISSSAEQPPAAPLPH